MKSKIKYTDEPLGNLQIVDDFLPRPEQLVSKEDNIKKAVGSGELAMVDEEHRTTDN